MNDYEKLIRKLRNRRIALQAGLSGEDFPLLKEAADAIEELHQKLCDWCGVCPEERRRPYECEIIYPNMEVPEVFIEPPKEGTE